MNHRELAALLDEHLEGTAEADFELSRFTTYRIGGPAALYVEPATPGDLEVLGALLRAHGPAAEDLPVLLVGRGSNIVISDRGWPGLAMRLGPGFSWIRPLDGPPGSRRPGAGGLAAGSATPLPRIGNWAARRSLTGLEFTVGIPGSVGGAVRMNAGAHGQQIADTLAAVRIFDLRTFDLQERPVERLDLSYRHSNLAPTDVVVDATFRMRPGDRDEIRARMSEWRNHRAGTQPGALQNAGSTFKNPPGDSAGRLVEAAGLKGFTVGGASVSTKHANFFMASASATAQDVFDLVRGVQRRVHETFGVKLEPEVRFVGEFEEGDR